MFFFFPYKKGDFCSIDIPASETCICKVIILTDGTHWQMAVVGFEPMPPERLEP